MRLTVIDYGMGNLRSVSKALEHLGASVKVSSSPNDILTADKVVLPGVGAFGDAVQEIKSRGQWDAILKFAEKGRPFLGICLGLQLLFSESEESPGIPGLNLFSGRVIRFRTKSVKVPHMGWNQVRFRNPHPFLSGIESGKYYYFVHSFYPVPDDPSLVAGECGYGEETFAVMAGRDHIFATQFHPEKSQDAGLEILKNFIEA